MNIQEKLVKAIKNAVNELHQVTVEQIELQATRKEFEGDLTVVIFPLLRHVKMNPVQLGQQIGDYLLENIPEIEKFNVVQGFLNIVLNDAYYLKEFQAISDYETYGHQPTGNESIVVEYSSPNTNKPLHLGHIRNVLLGYSVAEIEKPAGKKVYKTQIINDRGIHICKSMLAWKKFGNGETPESSGIKGDKLAGNYYARFDKEYIQEIAALTAPGHTAEDAKAQAPILKEARQMLRCWERGEEETVALWEKLHGWVYEGFEESYKAIGVDFDSYYHESDTYLRGKDIVEQGLESGVFYKKEDGSVWCDLTEEGLDEKLVLRKDGTSVYITQDLGTAVQRVNDHPDVTGMIYTVGNEQDYHFKVLFLILKKLGYSWANNLYHLSYGMVDLPSGKMKSREGTVVDADELIAEMTATAKEIAEDLGKIDDLSDEAKNELYHIIGLGALKYFILKVDPKKRILFNPAESVDFQGNTGPFIQYTYARIQSILRKASEMGVTSKASSYTSLLPKEKELIKLILNFPEIIQNAADAHSPAIIANYTYELVKEFNSFYQNVPILGTTEDDEKVFRVQLSDAVGKLIKNAFGLLGIQVPERM